VTTAFFAFCGAFDHKLNSVEFVRVFVLVRRD
jgi:hypothetical protein